MTSHIIIEGSIASGKTSLINTIKHFKNYDNTIKVFTEPIDKWTNFCDINFLQKFYAYPKDMCFVFQNHVLNTMCSVHQKTLSVTNKLTIQERSIYSAFNVFCKTNFNNQTLNQYEYELIKNTYEKLIKDYPFKYIDKVIYLSCPAYKLLERIKYRGRSEEENVTLDYLKQLEESYEIWLKSISHSVIMINTDTDFNVTLANLINCIESINSVRQR